MPRRNAILLTLAAALLLPALAAAQTPEAKPAPPVAAVSAIDRLHVAIWPEYDRSDALVIYRIRLAASVKLPGQATVKLPAAVGKPHAVAKRGIDGQLYVAEHTYAVDGDWATVTVTTDVAELQLEYYAPISVEGDKRTFVFEWPGGAPVRELAYEIQEPVGAEAVTVVPAPAQRDQRSDGLTYDDGVVGGRAPDAPGRFELTYTKSDSRLTAEVLRGPQAGPPSNPPTNLGSGQLPAPPSPAPATATATPESGKSGGPSWALVGVLLVAAFAAGIWIGRASAPGDDEEEAEDNSAKSAKS